MTVVVYSPARDCGSCRSTKVRLQKYGIPYREVTVDDTMTETLRQEGFSAFPVVKVDFGDGAGWSWSGYRDADISRLAECMK